MDSNFQVKITADLSQLEKSLGNVKTLLGNVGTTAQSSAKVIKDSTDKATASVGNLNKTFQQTNDSSGRARLAAFAFGQVIRDAGFFSQSFGLGLLAISNNIPILIDQLVLLTGISGAAGVAISLIGSALTAGLTAFAYYAQSLARDGKSVTGVFKEMALDSETSLGRLVSYLSSPPASTILNQMIGSIQSGFQEAKALFRDFVSLAINLWDRFGTDIMNATSTIFSYLTETLKNQLKMSLNILKAFSALMQGDFSGVADAIGNIFKGIANQIINVLTFIASRGTQIIGSFVGLFDKLAGENIKNAGIQLKQFGDSLKFTSKESQSADFNLKKWVQTLDGSVKKTEDAEKATRGVADVYRELGIELEQIGAKTTNSFSQDAAERVKAYQRAIDELIKLGIKPASKEIQDLQALVGRFDLAASLGQVKNIDPMASIVKNQEAGVKKMIDNANLLGTAYKDLGLKLKLVDSNVSLTFSEKNAEKIKAYQQAIDFLIKSGFDPASIAVKQFQENILLLQEPVEKINEWGQYIIQTIGGDLVNAFNTMLTTGTLSFGGVMKAIGNMIKKLIAAAIAALILVSILQSLGMGGGLDFKKTFGMLSGLNLGGGSGGGGQTPFAEGGIVSGPTSALVGEYPGAKTNPEVIAPLDKLQSMIAGSGGGQMSGVLETRISGNDLVILMNKATKNRNSYF
jgi:hypothetical protein